METVKTRKPRHFNEELLQIQCVKWFNYQYPEVVIYHTPNGGFRNVREAARLKASGVFSGVADLFVMSPRAGYAGLYVEMKCGVGKQTPNQIFFQEAAEAQGYKYVLCYTFDEFKEVIDTYLKSTKTELIYKYK